MLIMQQCESGADFAAATELAAELGVWDSTETTKLGFVAQAVIDFYYTPDAESSDAWEPPFGLMLVVTSMAKSPVVSATDMSSHRSAR